MIFERGHFQSTRISKSFVNESLNEMRNFNSRSEYVYKKTVFLSHKHDDLEDMEELQGVMEFLDDLGVKVYIDSMDNRMPKETSGDTAKRIKDVIKFCDKFILLATDKAIESYWCNWELGIGDVHKYMQNIAVLPIKNKGGYDFMYKGNEYLKIYPYIDFRDGTTRYSDTNKIIEKGYYVCDPKEDDGSVVIRPLKDWLNR